LKTENHRVKKVMKEARVGLQKENGIKVLEEED